MGPDLTCPECDLPCFAMSDDVMRCGNCGQYWDIEDDTEGLWDRSSRHKTRLDREEDA